MITALDTNIFLAVLISNEPGASIAQRAIEVSRDQGDLTISAVCYAELVGQFDTRMHLDLFLRDFECAVHQLGPDEAFLAGQHFMQYRARGGPRTRIIADFIVAADAQLNADRLLTSDKLFFGQNFPSLTVVSPESF